MNDLTKVDFDKAARALSYETRAFIDGKFVNALSGKTFATINPATGKELGQIAECDAADVELAVAAARRAFESGSWSRAEPRHRKQVLLKLADLMEQHGEELALLESLDNGKAISDARSVDVPDSIATLRWHAEMADKIFDQVQPTGFDQVGMIVREAIGVVGAVLPWNFPIFVAIWKLAPALAGGNSVVVKPAELTSLTLLRIAQLAAEAGIPDGVLNVLPGMGETAGQAIGRHMDVDCVSFTGSGEVGRYFLKYSAESNLKRVVLELGGKSPAIVLDDVTDLQGIADQVAAGFLFNKGENCSAGSRLIIDRKVKDQFLDVLLPTVESWKVGDPLDPETQIGAMVEEAHMNKVLGYIDGAAGDGFKPLLAGGRTLEETGGFFVKPAVFDGVPNDATLAREEVFGPVLAVIPVDGVDEAVKVANDTPYGLASALYTDDLHRAHRVAKSIRAGTVSVNCFSEGDFASPFGGFKQSGFGGRDKGVAAHDQYLETKTIWIQTR
ncbi:aldehyde dehydrogenase [Croceicoccus bisphenolivorans]|uniref:aldehyde dehydrogenase n=1 Tax=Croceicoccus bisphenolivorans TaxID=1783232 RepID=UPI00082EC016|nr:aldehyde dehydrogenase [Croceicoccus bisphenolivorans]